MEFILILSYLFSSLSLLALSYKNLLISIINGRKKFHCRRCKTCCSLLVRLTKEDIARIVAAGYDRKFFALDNPGFLSRYKNTPLLKNYSLMRMENGRCIFFKVENGFGCCTIYGSRPDECRAFPVKYFMGIKMHDYRCRGN